MRVQAGRRGRWRASKPRRPGLQPYHINIEAPAAALVQAAAESWAPQVGWVSLMGTSAGRSIGRVGLPQTLH